MTDLLGDRAVDAIERHARNEQSVPAQPALQRAALAVGGAGRPGGVGSAARQHACATTTAARSGPMQRWSRRWTARSAACCRRSTPTGCPATPSSSSPATMAASASPTPGRSPASRRNCWKAACAFPALICWPDRIPAGRTSEQVMITMDWLPTLLDAAGTAPDAGLSAGRDQPAAGADGAARACAAHSCSGATRPTRSGPRATATSSTSRSATTPSCSTSWQTRASGPT